MSGFFFVADLIGFGKIIENSSEDALRLRIGEWVELVKAAAERTKIERTQLISDTLFAAVTDSEEGLRSLIALAQILLEEGVPKSLPVRGAISYGQFVWDARLTYGKAVIDAHALEVRQDWIGVACQSRMPHVDRIWGWERIACYPPPMKHGLIQLMPAVIWNIPESAALQRYLTGGNLTKEGENLQWSWASKLRNTIEFRLYLAHARAHKTDPAKFYGTLPVQALELDDPYV